MPGVKTILSFGFIMARGDCDAQHTHERCALIIRETQPCSVDAPPRAAQHSNATLICARTTWAALHNGFLPMHAMLFIALHCASCTHQLCCSAQHKVSSAHARASWLASFHELPQACQVDSQRVCSQVCCNAQQRRPCCCCCHRQLAASAIAREQQACQRSHL